MAELAHASTRPPRFSVISDETGQWLDDCIQFCRAEGLDGIEIRMVDGVAPLSLTDAQARDAARRIHDAGLFVTGIATPLLKWAMPGKTSGDLGDQFGFDRTGRSDEHLARDAIRIADIFETRNLRIFSFLTHDGFALDELAPALEPLLGLAEANDKVLLLENEPVCNIGRFDELAAALERFDDPRLQGLPDIGNSAHIGEFPPDDLVAQIMPRVTHAHFKDYSAEPGRFVPLGQGDVRLDDYLTALFAGAAGRQLTFSLETHTPDQPLEGTRASFRALKAAVTRCLG
jgi:sugar phosphate isomerase/epimerase